jgi:hypothetical protein
LWYGGPETNHGMPERRHKQKEHLFEEEYMKRKMKKKGFKEV